MNCGAGRRGQKLGYIRNENGFWLLKKNNTIEDYK
jgi:hypothetical protein